MSTVTTTSTTATSPESGMTTPGGGGQPLLPETLRWRPLPAPLVEHAPSALSVLRTPDQPVPCRRCLRDSRAGDEMLLLSYDPFLGDSPYRCASPIYVHAKPSCEPAALPTSGGAFAEQQRGRLLSVRAYDGGHMLRGAEVVAGDRLVETCQQLLGGGSAAEYCHVHYAEPGCFAVRVEKAPLSE
ncbi:hypothetical protein F4802DRAFT_602179 [Xylaria palmicola]|nr:hypothetical protein F4802DRAFT_602179 [Xylaria palmicola]